MPPIGDFFEAEYGDGEFESKSGLLPGVTPLIASGAKNNGVYGLFNIPATKQNVISVARTGSVCSAFFHGYPCEISSDALVLRPHGRQSAAEMIWFAQVISLNRFRFTFGRKVTPVRVKNLEVPEVPKLLPSVHDVAESVSDEFKQLTFLTARSSSQTADWKTVDDLFDIVAGNSFSLANLARDISGVNFVSRRTKNNGVSARVARTNVDPFPAGCLTVALSGAGGVMETSVQTAQFYTAFHVAVLTPKIPMSLEEKLFCAQAVRLNRFRYGFGRQANRTLPAIRIPPFPEWLLTSTVIDAQAEIASRLRSLYSDDIYA
jgi:hypothetical protein